MHGSRASRTAFKCWSVRMEMYSSTVMLHQAPKWRGVVSCGLSQDLPWLRLLICKMRMITELCVEFHLSIWRRAWQQAILTFILGQPIGSRRQRLEQMREWVSGLVLSRDRDCLQMSTSPFSSTQDRLWRWLSMLNSDTVTRTKWFEITWLSSGWVTNTSSLGAPSILLSWLSGPLAPQTEVSVLRMKSFVPGLVWYEYMRVLARRWECLPIFMLHRGLCHLQLLKCHSGSSESRYTEI